MKRGFGGMNRKDLMLKIRRARLRKARLRQALAQGPGQLRGVGMLRQKRLQRIQQALSARQERLQEALKNNDEARSRLSQRASSQEGRAASSRAVVGGLIFGKGLERAQQIAEARRQRLERMLRNSKAIEDAVKKRLQASGAQVLSLYDPTEITAEQEALQENEEEDEASGASGSDNAESAPARQRSFQSAGNQRRASRKGRKGH